MATTVPATQNVDHINDDISVIDDVGIQQDDLIDELLGGQDSPALDDSLEVPG